jgi:hypothetical protein
VNGWAKPLEWLGLAVVAVSAWWLVTDVLANDVSRPAAWPVWRPAMWLTLVGAGVVLLARIVRPQMRQLPVTIGLAGVGIVLLAVGGAVPAVYWREYDADYWQTWSGWGCGLPVLANAIALLVGHLVVATVSQPEPRRTSCVEVALLPFGIVGGIAGLLLLWATPTVRALLYFNFDHLLITEDGPALAVSLTGFAALALSTATVPWSWPGPNEPVSPGGG